VAVRPAGTAGVLAAAVVIVMTAVGSAATPTAQPSSCTRRAASLSDVKPGQARVTVVRKYVTITRTYVFDQSTGQTASVTGSATVNPPYRKTVRIVQPQLTYVTADHQKVSVPMKITRTGRASGSLGNLNGVGVAVLVYTQSRRCGHSGS
jgi:hypothetical protein